MEVCDVVGDHVAMIQLDLAKAFDLVSYDLLFSAPEHLNLGSGIFECVKMAYGNCSTRIVVSVELTDTVCDLQHSKGVHSHLCYLRPTLSLLVWLKFKTKISADTACFQLRQSYLLTRLTSLFSSRTHTASLRQQL